MALTGCNFLRQRVQKKADEPNNSPPYTENQGMETPRVIDADGHIREADKTEKSLAINAQTFYNLPLT